MKTDSILEYIEKNLSEKRLRHTYGVRDTAVMLAEIYGEDKEKAETAALFHDMLKGRDSETLNAYVREFGLEDKYIDNPNLAHGKIAAILMERDYGITDRDIINAVSYHTTGRAGMSLLEKIIYIADASEPGRNYPGVERLRSEMKTDIDSAVLAALESTIKLVSDEGKFLDDDTVKARDYLLERKTKDD